MIRLPTALEPKARAMALESGLRLCRLVAMDIDRLRVGAPSQFARDWVSCAIGLLEEIPMSDQSITARLRKYLVEHFPSARNHALRDDDHLLANGILDSLGVLDLVGYLEAEFGIAVADEDLMPEHFETLRRLTAFVGEKQSVGSR